MYLFYSIYKALIYATVIIAIFMWLHQASFAREK